MEEWLQLYERASSLGWPLSLAVATYLFYSGKIFPKWYVDKLEKEKEELKEQVKEWRTNFWKALEYIKR